MEKTPPIITKLYGGRVEVRFFPDSHIYMVDGKRKTGVTTFLGVKDKSNALLSWQREEVMKHLLPMFDAEKRIELEHIVQALFASDVSKTKAADLGTKIHEWCENYIKHKLKVKGHEQMPEMPEDQNVVTGVTSFLEWESAHKVKFLWSEKILYSKKNDYVGQADFAAKVDGMLCLCDIKTGNGMYNSVRAQTAAYAMADTEETKTKYDGRWAIRLAKETPTEYQSRMALKDRIRTLLGRRTNNPEPYQIFEAKFLDNEKHMMKDDFEAFLSHQNVYQWDSRTDFWKEKNGRV